ncbi:MAG: hypothetical protein AAGF82_07970 [Pseudomonadota bacterium]
MTKLKLAAIAFAGTAMLAAALPADAWPIPDLPMYGPGKGAAGSSSASVAPVTCTLPAVGQTHATIPVIAQSAQDCARVGGVARS